MQAIASALRARKHGGNAAGKKPKFPLHPIDGASDEQTLLSMFLDLYWDGVYREVKHILLSLRALRDTPSTGAEESMGSGDAVLGYDAFLDHVCKEPKHVERTKGIFSPQGSETSTATNPT